MLQKKSLSEAELELLLEARTTTEGRFTTSRSSGTVVSCARSHSSDAPQLSSATTRGL